MPQLDYLIMCNESIVFIFLFLVCYFIFLKYVLSVLSFELKYKIKLELFYIDQLLNINNTVNHKKDINLSLYLLSYIQTLLRLMSYSLKNKGFLFNSYRLDYLLLKIKYLKY